MKKTYICKYCGKHQWNNVQLACRICNSLKRDNI